jgi:hypothetical protein
MLNVRPEFEKAFPTRARRLDELADASQERAEKTSQYTDAAYKRISGERMADQVSFGGELWEATKETLEKDWWGWAESAGASMVKGLAFLQNDYMAKPEQQWSLRDHWAHELDQIILRRDHEQQERRQMVRKEGGAGMDFLYGATKGVLQTVAELYLTVKTAGIAGQAISGAGGALGLPTIAQSMMNLGRAKGSTTMIKMASGDFMAKTLPHTARMATLRFLTTDGNMEDRSKRAAIMAAYQNTPLIASPLAGRMGESFKGLSNVMANFGDMKLSYADGLAMLLDWGANTGISIYLGQYSDAEKAAEELAKGDGKDWREMTATDRLPYRAHTYSPAIASDFYFTLKTRATPSLRGTIAKLEGNKDFMRDMLGKGKDEPVTKAEIDWLARAHRGDFDPTGEVNVRLQQAEKDFGAAADQAQVSVQRVRDVLGQDDRDMQRDPSVILRKMTFLRTLMGRDGDPNVALRLDNTPRPELGNLSEREMYILDHSIHGTHRTEAENIRKGAEIIKEEMQSERDQKAAEETKQSQYYNIITHAKSPDEGMIDVIMRDENLRTDLKKAFGDEIPVILETFGIKPDAVFQAVMEKETAEGTAVNLTPKQIMQDVKGALERAGYDKKLIDEYFKENQETLTNRQQAEAKMAVAEGLGIERDRLVAQRDEMGLPVKDADIIKEVAAKAIARGRDAKTARAWRDAELEKLGEKKEGVLEEGLRIQKEQQAIKDEALAIAKESYAKLEAEAERLGEEINYTSEQFYSDVKTQLLERGFDSKLVDEFVKEQVGDKPTELIRDKMIAEAQTDKGVRDAYAQSMKDVVDSADGVDVRPDQRIRMVSEATGLPAARVKKVLGDLVKTPTEREKIEGRRIEAQSQARKEQTISLAIMNRNDQLQKGELASYFEDVNARAKQISTELKEIGVNMSSKRIAEMIGEKVTAKQTLADIAKEIEGKQAEIEKTVAEVGKEFLREKTILDAIMRRNEELLSGKHGDVFLGAGKRAAQISAELKERGITVSANKIEGMIGERPPTQKEILLDIAREVAEKQEDFDKRVIQARQDILDKTTKEAKAEIAERVRGEVHQFALDLARQANPDAPIKDMRSAVREIVKELNVKVNEDWIKDKLRTASESKLFDLEKQAGADQQIKIITDYAKDLLKGFPFITREQIESRVRGVVEGKMSRELEKILKTAVNEAFRWAREEGPAAERPAGEARAEPVRPAEVRVVPKELGEKAETPKAEIPKTPEQLAREQEDADRAGDDVYGRFAKEPAAGRAMGTEATKAIVASDSRIEVVDAPKDAPADAVARYENGKITVFGNRVTSYEQLARVIAAEFTHKGFDILKGEQKPSQYFARLFKGYETEKYGEHLLNTLKTYTARDRAATADDFKGAGEKPVEAIMDGKSVRVTGMEDGMAIVRGKPVELSKLSITERDFKGETVKDAWDYMDKMGEMDKANDTNEFGRLADEMLSHMKAGMPTAWRRFVSDAKMRIKELVPGIRMSDKDIEAQVVKAYEEGLSGREPVGDADSARNAYAREGTAPGHSPTDTWKQTLAKAYPGKSYPELMKLRTDAGYSSVFTFAEDIRKGKFTPPKVKAEATQIGKNTAKLQGEIITAVSAKQPIQAGRMRENVRKIADTLGGHAVARMIGIGPQYDRDATEAKQKIDRVTRKAVDRLESKKAKRLAKAAQLNKDSKLSYTDDLGRKVTLNRGEEMDLVMSSIGADLRKVVELWRSGGDAAVKAYIDALPDAKHARIEAFAFMGKSKADNMLIYDPNTKITFEVERGTVKHRIQLTARELADIERNADTSLKSLADGVFRPIIDQDLAPAMQETYLSTNAEMLPMLRNYWTRIRDYSKLTKEEQLALTGMTERDFHVLQGEGHRETLYGTDMDNLSKIQERQLIGAYENSPIIIRSAESKLMGLVHDSARYAGGNIFFNTWKAALSNQDTRRAIEDRVGKQAYENLYKAIEAKEGVVDTTSTWFDKMFETGLGKFTKVILQSFETALRQTASIHMAAPEIGHNNLRYGIANLFTARGREDIKELLKYAADMDMRRRHFRVEMPFHSDKGRGGKEFEMWTGTGGFISRMDRKSDWYAKQLTGRGDRKTVDAIGLGVLNKMRRANPGMSKAELYEKAAMEWSRVVNITQVSSDPLFMSEWRRSKSPIKRMFAYMSGAQNAVFSQLSSAISDYSAGVKGSDKKLAEVLFATAMQTLHLTAIAYAARRIRKGEDEANERIMYDGISNFFGMLPGSSMTIPTMMQFLSNATGYTTALSPPVTGGRKWVPPHVRPVEQIERAIMHLSKGDVEKTVSSAWEVGDWITGFNTKYYGKLYQDLTD